MILLNIKLKKLNIDKLSVLEKSGSHKANLLLFLKLSLSILLYSRI